jgi:hypothetical protein
MGKWVLVPESIIKEIIIFLEDRIRIKKVNCLLTGCHCCLNPDEDDCSDVVYGRLLYNLDTNIHKTTEIPDDFK